MSKTSQLPYYIGIGAYLGINAFIYFVMNQTVTGNMSDVYLGASTLCGLLAAITLLYIFMEDNEEDATEADVVLMGITFHKGFWYIGSIACIGARLFFAYQSNHNSTGAESVWGYVWFVASAVLLIMTSVNAKQYFQKKARIAENERKAARAASTPINTSKAA